MNRRPARHSRSLARVGADGTVTVTLDAKLEVTMSLSSWWTDRRITRRTKQLFSDKRPAYALASKAGEAVLDRYAEQLPNDPIDPLTSDALSTPHYDAVFRDAVAEIPELVAIALTSQNIFLGRLHGVHCCDVAAQLLAVLGVRKGHAREVGLALKVAVETYRGRDRFKVDPRGLMLILGVRAE
jgi:hypothetical protein